MTLVDTSVWVEFLRGTGSSGARHVRDQIGRDLVTSEPVMMELLAGARPGAQTQRIEALLLAQGWQRIDPTLDFRGAVDVYQVTRATGHQPRSLQDCLIAAVALRTGETVAHRDSDFDYIARATGLPVLDLRD